MLLKIVSHARNIGGDLHTVGEADACNLTNRGIRLPRRLGSHLRTHAALEGRGIIGWAIVERIKTARERRHARLRRLMCAASLGKLIDGRHLEKEDPRRVNDNIKELREERNYPDSFVLVSEIAKIDLTVSCIDENYTTLLFVN